MSDQDKNNAPAQEPAKNEPPKVAPVETPEAKPAAETPKQPTIAEAMNPAPAEPASKPEKKEETVPLSALIELKKSNKDQKKEIERLQALVGDKDSREDFADSSMENLVEEFPDLDPKFLKKFHAAVKAEVRKETQNELRPLQEKDRAEKIDKAFALHFGEAMKSLPEYEKVVRPETIKALSLIPSNANKTFIQLIEETYGHLVQSGKGTMDRATSPRVGKEDAGEIDMARAKTDPAYFKKIMANPATKAKYNESLAERVSSRL